MKGETRGGKEKRKTKADSSGKTDKRWLARDLTPTGRRPPRFLGLHSRAHNWANEFAIP